MDEQSELRLELKRGFTDFLDQDFGRETGVGRYVKKVDDIIKQYPVTKRVRLEVDLQGERRGWRQHGGGKSNWHSRMARLWAPAHRPRLARSNSLPPPPPADLSDYNEELHRRVLGSPATCLPPFEEALEEFIRNRSPKVRSLREGGVFSQQQKRAGGNRSCVELGQQAGAVGGDGSSQPCMGAMTCACSPAAAAAAGGVPACAHCLQRRVWAPHRHPPPAHLRGGCGLRPAGAGAVQQRRRGS